MDDVHDADEPVDETELAIEGALRPASLAEFVGQQKVRGQLQLLLDAARIQQRPADHILLSGPPGLGKTTLAMIVAHESARPLRMSSGPAIQHAGRPRRAPVEPHARARCCSSTRCTAWRAPPRRCCTSRWRTSASTSWSARAPGPPASRSISRRSRSWAQRRGPGCCPTRSATASGSPLTSSTTNPKSSSGSSSAPPRCSRVDLPPASRAEIARRSRGTPRIANRLLRRVRDFMIVRGGGGDTATVDAALDLYDVDSIGLDRLDRAVLDALVRRFRGGPVGLEHARRRRRRGGRDDRVRRRAVPRPHRLHGPHARAAGSPCRRRSRTWAPRTSTRRSDSMIYNRWRLSPNPLLKAAPPRRAPDSKGALASMEFLSNYGLIILLVVLLGFMFWSSRRRMQKQKLEQEAEGPPDRSRRRGAAAGRPVRHDRLVRPREPRPARDRRDRSGRRDQGAQPGDPARRRPRRGHGHRGRVHRGRGERGRATSRASRAARSARSATTTRGREASRPSTPTPTRTPSPRPDRSPFRGSQKADPSWRLPPPSGMPGAR